MMENPKTLAGEAWPIEGRRKKILDFIRSHKIRFGKAPSYRAIAKHVGSASTSTAYHYVRQLEEDGWILPAQNKRFTPSNIILSGEVYLPPDEVETILVWLERVRTGSITPIHFMDYLGKLIRKRRFMPKGNDNGKSP